MPFMPMRLSSCDLPAICITLCALFLFSPSCEAASVSKIPTHAGTSATQLKRSDPGYLQYLENKSLLGGSRELARIVSGSQIMWHAPSTDPTPERLLQTASAWLSIHPIPLLTGRQDPVFRHLANPVFWKIMREIGMEGLYISPTSGTGAIWRSANRRVTEWEGMVQLPFTDDVGDDRDYGTLLGRANQGHFFLGLEMTQAATGLGPDFFLGCRGNPEFQRLYRMREIPASFWEELPASTEEWDCQALSADLVKKLVAEKVLPEGEDPRSPLCGVPWGWAVTGTVLTGERGTPKRFAYRYYLNPLRPIMDWEDPQAGARRILSACAIRRVGTQGAALLGMQTRALHGLTPGAKLHDANPEPELSAAVSIGREVRRYGAWTWLEDELSLNQTQAFLRQGPDFAVDTVSSPGAEHALLTGDAELVRFMYDEALRIGLDQRRLVRRLPDERGLSYALPHLCSLANAPAALTPAGIQEQAKRSGGAWAGQTLYAGSTGLAALALNEDSSSPPAKAKIRQGQTLLLFFKAMQPGLFMLPARDLLGALPLDGKQGRRPPPGNEPALAMHGAYNLLSTADDSPAGKGGLPRTSVLYPPIDVQEMQPAENFLKDVGEILRVRRQTGIASGRFVTRLPTKNPGSIALLFALPGDQGAVLTICNFSRAASHETFNLSAPKIQAFAKGGVRHIWGAPADGSSVSLGPWQGAAFLLGKMPDATGSASSRTAAPAKTSGTTEDATESLYTPGIQRLKEGEKSYVIQPGDQLNAIAARHAVSPEAVMERNNIPSPDLVTAGRTLIIPPPGADAARFPKPAVQQTQMPPAPPISPTLQKNDSGSLQTEKNGETPLLDGEQSHIVQRGDTIANIAARYKVSPKNLIQRNRLSSPELIVQGKALVIPASGASPRQSQADKRPAAKVEEQASLPSSIPAPIPSRAEVPQEPQSENAPRPETFPAELLDGEQSHIVQRGDTIANIAARYKVSPKNLIQRNRLPSPYLIVQGKVLVIPASGASPRQSQADKRPAAKVEEQASLPSSIPAPIPSRAEVPQEPQSENAPRPETFPAELLDGEQSHIVQRGDTIANIAARYKVSPKNLIQRNRLASPDLIVQGKVLVIPASGASPRQSQAGKRSAVKVEEQAILPSSIPAPIPPRAKVPQEPQRENAPLPETSPAALLDGEQSHIVQKGDTIANIAACYGVSPKTLIQRNRLSSPNLIVRGTVLIIPASGR